MLHSKADEQQYSSKFEGCLEKMVPRSNFFFFQLVFLILLRKLVNNANLSCVDKVMTDLAAAAKSMLKVYYQNP